METIKRKPFVIKRLPGVTTEPLYSKPAPGTDIRTELPFGSKLQIPIFHRNTTREVRNTMTQYTEYKATIYPDPNRPGTLISKTDEYAAQKKDEK